MLGIKRMKCGAILRGNSYCLGLSVLPLLAPAKAILIVSGAHTDTGLRLDIENMHFPNLNVEYFKLQCWIVKQTLLYSWRFFRYSAPIHWLVHGHMTSNNETVSREMPWAGNIAKTMTSNGKQFTVTREMFTAVARDRWNLSAVFKFCFCFVLLYNKSLNVWYLGEQ